MTQDEMKQKVAKAALDYVVEGELIGVGTGSTARFFIDELATLKHKIAGAVASSEDTKNRLIAHGIRVLDLNDVTHLPVYIDGADEIDRNMKMIKGGGAALTREKIVSAVAESFVCIVDERKCVEVLGAFPLPVEIIPMSRAYVMRALLKIGGNPVLREGSITDNGNMIIDVHGLTISDPQALEQEITALAGVVTCGLFAKRGADICLVGAPSGVRIIGPQKIGKHA